MEKHEALLKGHLFPLPVTRLVYRSLLFPPLFFIRRSFFLPLTGYFLSRRLLLSAAHSFCCPSHFCGFNFSPTPKFFVASLG